MVDAQSLKGYAALPMRIVLGLIFLWHGAGKALDPAGAMEKFLLMGFQGWLGPVIGWLEVILGALILIGLYTRISSIVLAIVIFVAAVAVHLPNGVTAGLERDLMMLASLIALTLLGSGKVSMDKVINRKS